MEVNNSNSFCTDINQVFKAPSVSLPIDNDCIQTLINYLPTEGVMAFSLVCKNAKMNADIVILNRAKEAGFDPKKIELDCLYPAQPHVYLKDLYNQVKALYETKKVIPTTCIQTDLESKIDSEKTLKKLQNLSHKDLLYIYTKEIFYSLRYKMVKIFIDAHEKKCLAQPQLNEETLKLFERDTRTAYYRGISSEILVKRGFNFININAKFSSGKTLLHLAAQKGDCFFADFLLKNKADINCLDSFSSNPLFEAVLFDKTDMVKLLLKQGSRVDLICSEGRTCLHYAKSVEIVKLLIENGVNVDAVERQVRTALDLAKLYSKGGFNHFEDIVDYLESYQNNK